LRPCGCSRCSDSSEGGSRCDEFTARRISLA
jgi:hypothetical protein